MLAVDNKKGDQGESSNSEATILGIRHLPRFSFHTPMELNRIQPKFHRLVMPGLRWSTTTRLPTRMSVRVQVWLSDDGTSDAYEGNTVVWGEPRNESLAFTESSTASSSSSTWNMAKEITLPIARLCTRISFNHYVSSSNI